MLLIALTGGNAGNMAAQESRVYLREDQTSEARMLMSGLSLLLD